MKKIFETPDFSVSCKNSLSGKSVLVEVTATNPVDGKDYVRCAGWLSTTYTLHGFDSTRAYAFEKAALLLVQHKEAILEAMISYATELGPWANHDLEARLSNANRKEAVISSHPIEKQHRMNRDFWVGKIRTAQL
jgi:hypothetical protein